MIQKFSKEKIKDSKNAALEKIKKFLDSEDIESQFDDIAGGYYSSDKFIVTWNDNWKGIPSEFGIDKCDSFYHAYSGYKAIYVTRGLLHEKQLEGYNSIYRALIDVGMKLCSEDEKRAFFETYVTKYNARLKLEREKQN